MAIYTISDLHLSFDSAKPMDIFGSAWHNHYEHICLDWQKKVCPEDFVILPGDHSWALQAKNAVKDLLFIHNLPGTKILLKGNHDLWWGTAKKMDELKAEHGLDSLIFMHNDSLLLPSGGKKHAIAGTRGWLCPGDNDYKPAEDDKIYLREAGRLESSIKKASAMLSQLPAIEKGNLYIFLHYPPFNQEKETLFTKHIEAAGATACYYGHIHGIPAADKKSARRTNIKLWENSTSYSLVSCDYTENQLIKVSD